MVTMSKLLELLLGSILITIFTVAFLFFFALQYIFRADGVVNCTWQGSARAWIDSNGDGRVSPDEPPLGGVELYVEQNQFQLIDLHVPVITDTNGDVQLTITLPGCSTTLFEIYVNIPQGYRITTRPRIEVNTDRDAHLITEPVYYFGFMPDR
jgi:hypothetical protein